MHGSDDAADNAEPAPPAQAVSAFARRAYQLRRIEGHDGPTTRRQLREEFPAWSGGEPDVEDTVFYDHLGCETSPY